MQAINRGVFDLCENALHTGLTLVISVIIYAVIQMNIKDIYSTCFPDN
jgi:hypothetical protein